MEAVNEKLLIETYDNLIEVALCAAPVHKVEGLISDQFMCYGTTADEEMYGFEGLKWMVDRSTNELGDVKYEIKRYPKFRNFFSHGYSALFIEEVEILIGEGADIISIRARVSTLCEYLNERWMIHHFHVSTPDANTQEGEAWPIEEWKRKNKELEELVAEKTADLTYKNKELEIEASLERVRTTAMAMQLPEDLLKICERLFKELQAVGLKNLRNALIHTFNDEEKYFTDYDYSEFTGGCVSRIPNSGHPAIDKFINEVRSSSDAFTEITISGKELEDWRAFRQSNNEAPDARLEEATALYYYFYSVGPADIGISTFASISAQERELLKRYRNVFDLAYRRYLDIEQAMAQTREAQLESNLEKVRSSSLAMHRSEELGEVVAIVFEKLKDLHIPATAVGISLPVEGSKDLNAYVCGEHETGLVITNYLLPLFDNVISNDLSKALEKQLDFFVGRYSKEEKNSFYQYLFKHSSISQVPDDIKHMILQSQAYTITMVAVKHALFTINDFEGKELTAHQVDVVKRFAHVFEQAYTRFLDLQKAEAQAREAEIELALERVRARTMAMQHSDELADASFLLDSQVRALGIKTWGCAFNIYGENESTEWFSSAAGTMPAYKTPREEIFLRYYEAGESGEAIHIEEFAGEDCEAHYNYLCTVPVVGDALKKIKEGGGNFPIRQVDHATYFKYGYLLFITLEPAPEAHDIFKRFAKVFEQTYTRFLDLQKAEAQAREAQIELALERVRARTMAMHRSGEVMDVAGTLFQELKKLGFAFGASSIIIMDKKSGDAEYWIAGFSKKKFPESYRVKYFQHPYHDALLAAWKTGKKYIVYDLAGEEKKAYDEVLFSQTGYKNIPEAELKLMMGIKSVTFSIAFMKHGALHWGPTLLNEEQANLLQRFANVFEQSYTRFLDLQKAEAQARQAQIEAASERVRSRSLGMHHTSEIQSVIHEVHNELLKLNISIFGGSFIVINKDVDAGLYVWGAGATADTTTKVLVPDFGMPFCTKLIEGIKTKSGFFTEEFSGQQKIAYFTELFKHQPWSEISDEDKKNILESDGGYTRSVSVLNNTSIFIVNQNGRKFTAEENDILRHFSKIFEQSYVRFLDLQNAEAQARESQINLAVERVRAKALAMFRSEEILEVVVKLKEELMGLDIPGVVASTIFLKEENENYRMWDLTSIEHTNEKVHSSMDVSFRLEESHPDLYIRKMFADARHYFLVTENERDIQLTLQWFRDHGRTGEADAADNFVKTTQLENLYHPTVQLNNGRMCIDLLEAPSPEIESILTKMGAAFDLAYKRFEDLKNSEEQLREARIEAGLERVRTQTAAMNKSQELEKTVSVIFSELDKLELETLRCGIGIFNETDDSADIWTTTKTQGGFALNISGNEPMYWHPMLKGTRAAFDLQEDFSYVLQGEELERYYKAISSAKNFKLPESTSGLIHPKDAIHYYYCTFFHSGGLYFFREKPFTEEVIKVIRRFANAFSLAYKRFEDLKQSEARTLEAIKASSLDRVRAEIASMRTTEDLKLITPLVFRELTTLEVPFFRCGVFIIDELREEIKIYLSSPDGHSLGAMNVKLASNPVTINAVEHWRKNMVYTEHWNKEQFIAWMQTMINEGQIKSPETYKGATAAPGSLDMHFVPFAQGMLYVGNNIPLSPEKINLVTSLAEAFSMAYARYEDFNKLEAANQQIEKTLVDLKQAQSQLIQSEKMASLGELTAGIAHEIQNPLNFVNNFSEVNIELIAEMIAEIDEGNIKEAKDIAVDIEGNEVKINLHGKRADAIVKGMLQHSRKNSDKKEPTDINALAEEYLRLSYHGLKAKDKSFNSDFKTDFDKGVGKIEVIPQDFGRVLLNLYNNAFYAVAEKKKSRALKGVNYMPTVWVTTKRISSTSGAGSLIISVRDNGNGIPQKVLDKVYQPFFTTKPTGQGTGLGLSLSYDIIKAHGGEIKVETIEGEGATFIIELPVK